MIDRQLEALSELETIRRTCFRAQIAEHAAGRVEDERRKNLLLVDLFAFAHFAPNRADFDAIDRAGKRAQIARDAERRSVIRVEIETRRAAKSLGNFGPLERVLLGVDRL